MVSGGRFGGGQRIQGIVYPPANPRQQEDLMQEQLAGLAVNRTKASAGDAIGLFLQDHLGELQKQRAVPREIAKENREQQRDLHTAIQKEGFGLLTNISDILGTQKAQEAKVEQWATALFSRPESVAQTFGVAPQRAALVSQMFKPYLSHLTEKEQATEIAGILGLQDLDETSRGDFVSDFRDRMAGKGEIPAKILEKAVYLMRMSKLSSSVTALSPDQKQGIKDAQESIKTLHLQGIRDRKSKLFKLYQEFQKLLPPGHLPDIEEALSIEESAARYDADHKTNLLKEEAIVSGGPLRDPSPRPFSITHRANVDPNDAAPTSGSEARAAAAPAARINPLPLKGPGRVPPNFVSGQRGPHIITTQQILEELGYLRADQISGTYDIYTMRAVNDFKAQHVPRSKANGVLTRKHMGVLNAQLKANSPDASNPDSQQTGVRDERIDRLKLRLSTPGRTSVIPQGLSEAYAPLFNDASVQKLPQLVTKMRNVLFPKPANSEKAVPTEIVARGLRLADDLGLTVISKFRNDADAHAGDLQDTLDVLGDERMKMLTARAVQESGVMKIFGDATNADFMNNMLKKLQSDLGLNFEGSLMSEAAALIHKAAIDQGGTKASADSMSHLDDVTLNRLVQYIADQQELPTQEFNSREAAVAFLRWRGTTVNDVGAAAVGSAYQHLTDLLSQANKAGDTPDIILGRLRPINATYDVTQMIFNAGMNELTAQEQATVTTSRNGMRAFNTFVREEERDRQYMKSYYNRFEAQLKRYMKRPLTFSKLTGMEFLQYIWGLADSKQLGTIMRDESGAIHPEEDRKKVADRVSDINSRIQRTGKIDEQDGTYLKWMRGKTWAKRINSRTVPIEFVIDRASKSAYYSIKTDIHRSVKRRSEKRRFQELRARINEYSTHR